jgi:hypothetical protein
MANLCPAGCAPITLLENPAQCEITNREKTPARIAFWPCDVPLPDPLQGSIAPLFANGTIVVSSYLSDFTFGDPTTEDVAIADCFPTKRRIVSREITFNDRTVVTALVGSPAVEDPYWGEQVWADWLSKHTRLRAMLIYCDGDVRIFKNKNGTPAAFDLFGFLNYSDLSGGVRFEFKQFSMLFNGDPLAIGAPDFNLEEEGIVI